MESTQTRKAVAAAVSTASAFDLAVDDVVVLNDSNRLVVHLTPCDTVLRVTPTTHHEGHQVSPEREADVVRQLGQIDCPVATLDARVEPRVHLRDGFKITFWTHYEPLESPPLRPADYTGTLERLHAGLRQIKVLTPHAVDRVAAVQLDAATREITPDLAEPDRTFLVRTLGDLRKSIFNRHVPEQLLHGEPHPGNVLSTRNGALLIDFENTSHGPVEYDLGWVPREVGDRYAGADQELIGECRGLVLAMIATYRWRHDDQHPSGRESGVAFLNALRNGPPWPAHDEVTW
ncbi:phosphotransferase family protein [Microlunatus sp. GCM10028923]|uniref:phosphotransferase family protein n=1 Tax=Microlunatus sp. GCM10028923 TaxID=3273400 RepID=UPI00361143B7